MDIAAQYLFTCKDNYFAGIRPAASDSKNKKGYKDLIEIAQLYFIQKKEEDFASFFMEYQYWVDLWTAHLLLEYGQPNESLAKKCLQIIKKHSDTPIDPELAAQEKDWLKMNEAKYNFQDNE